MQIFCFFAKIFFYFVIHRLLVLNVEMWRYTFHTSDNLQEFKEL